VAFYHCPGEAFDGIFGDIYSVVLMFDITVIMIVSTEHCHWTDDLDYLPRETGCKDILVLISLSRVDGDPALPKRAT
jgi:hypothetical protein